MRKTEKRLTVLGIILTVSFFWLATIGWTATAQLYHVGIIEMFWIIVGISSTAGCLFWVCVTWRSLKTKTLKETFFFVLFVVSFSITSHVMINFILRQNFPIRWIVAFWIIVGVPISSIFAGYSERTVWKRLRRLALNQGVTWLALIFLALIPIIEISTSAEYHFLTTGMTSSLGMFESGNDMEKVQGSIINSLFTAEVPIPSDTVFEAKQMVNVTNRSNAYLPLNLYLEDLSGNLSKIRQLKIFFTLGNGSEICLFSANNGSVKSEALFLRMCAHETITMGVISSAQNVSPTENIVMSLLIECARNNLSVNISITKAND